MCTAARRQTSEQCRFAIFCYKMRYLWRYLVTTYTHHQLSCCRRRSVTSCTRARSVHHPSAGRMSDRLCWAEEAAPCRECSDRRLMKNNISRSYTHVKNLDKELQERHHTGHSFNSTMCTSYMYSCIVQAHSAMMTTAKRD